MSENYHSYHIFMFPFRIVKEANFNLQYVTESLTKCGWISTAALEILSNYNEKKFFHELAHPCLFESDGAIIRQFVFDKSKILGTDYKDLYYTIHFNRRIPEKRTELVFTEDIVKPPDRQRFEKKSYSLKIDRITLDIYEHGIGIFSFHLINEKNQNPEDILLINQFGRRLFPPFLDEYPEGFGLSLTDPLTGTKHREMPVSISIGIANLQGEINISTIKQESIIFEEFADFGSTKEQAGKFEPYLKAWTENKFLPGHIGYFFREENGRKGISDKKFSFFVKEIEIFADKHQLDYTLDDRMFVICWYGAHQLSYDYRKLKNTVKEEENKFQHAISGLCSRLPGGYEASGFSRNPRQHKALMLNRTVNGYGYSANNFWYQFMFVDGYGPTCSNDLMKEELIERHTYARWVENNTLYGITRYSFVCITEPLENLVKPFPNAGFIVGNIRTLYFRMVSLVLFQRALVLKYAEDASIVSKLIEPDIPTSENDVELIKAVEILIKNYTAFINRIFHREVTAQEQGIEIYDMLQTHLRVEYQAKELEKEIDEFHCTVDLIRTRQINDGLLETNKVIAFIKEKEDKRIEDEKQNRKKLDSIAKLGGVFIVPTILAALIQAHVLPEKDYFYLWLKTYTKNIRMEWLWNDFHYSFLINILLYIGVGILSIFILIDSGKKFWQWIFLLTSTLIYLFLYPCDTWVCCAILGIFLGCSIYKYIVTYNDKKNDPCLNNHSC